MTDKFGAIMKTVDLPLKETYSGVLGVVSVFIFEALTQCLVAFFFFLLLFLSPVFFCFCFLFYFCFISVFFSFTYYSNFDLFSLSCLYFFLGRFRLFWS